MGHAATSRADPDVTAAPQSQAGGGRASVSLSSAKSRLIGGCERRRHLAASFHAGAAEVRLGRQGTGGVTVRLRLPALSDSALRTGSKPLCGPGEGAASRDPSQGRFPGDCAAFSSHRPLPPLSRRWTSGHCGGPGAGSVRAPSSPRSPRPFTGSPQARRPPATPPNGGSILLSLLETASSCGLPGIDLQLPKTQCEPWPGPGQPASSVPSGTVVTQRRPCDSIR